MANIEYKGLTRYSETIWSICNLFNKGLYNLDGSPVSNITGCKDWYIPSIDELIAMKNAIGAENFSDMLSQNGGDPDYTYVWSSSVWSTGITMVYKWNYDDGSDDGSQSGNKRVTSNDYALALTRSF